MMNLLTINILLALGWVVVTGEFYLWNLVVGFIIGYAALWIAQPLYGQSAYFQKMIRIVRLGIYFAYELVVSGVRILALVFRPRLNAKPGIVAVPLDAESDMEIFLVANLISLTPGTLSLEISPDQRCLYVHVMFVDDVEYVRQRIKGGIEKRVLEVTR